MTSLEDFVQEALEYLSKHARRRSETDRGDDDGTLDLLPSPTLEGPKLDDVVVDRDDQRRAGHRCTMP